MDQKPEHPLLGVPCCIPFPVEAALLDPLLDVSKCLLVYLYIYFCLAVYCVDQVSMALI